MSAEHLVASVPLLVAAVGKPAPCHRLPIWIEAVALPRLERQRLGERLRLRGAEGALFLRQPRYAEDVNWVGHATHTGASHHRVSSPLLTSRAEVAATVRTAVMEWRSVARSRPLKRRVRRPAMPPVEVRRRRPGEQHIS